jgi:hypothetical protein
MKAQSNPQLNYILSGLECGVRTQLRELFALSQ